MKQIIPAVVLLFFLTACCEPVEPDLPACASAPAEVPEGEDGETKYAALTFDDGPRADTTARLLAKKLSCGCSLLYAPGLSSAGREEALSLPDIRRTMDSFATCDIALVGIGRLVPGCAVHKLGAADEEELAQAAQGNCAGEVALNRYTLEGKGLGPAFDRAIGVDMETLKHIPYVIAVAGGLCKADAVLGALRTGCIDVLIVDSLLARKLLEEPGTPGSEADGQHGRCL